MQPLTSNQYTTRIENHTSSGNYKFKYAFFLQWTVCCYLQLTKAASIPCSQGTMVVMPRGLCLAVGTVWTRPHPSINFIFPISMNTDTLDLRNRLLIWSVMLHTNYNAINAMNFNADAPILSSFVPDPMESLPTHLNSSWTWAAEYIDTIPGQLAKNTLGIMECSYNKVIGGCSLGAQREPEHGRSSA